MNVTHRMRDRELAKLVAIKTCNLRKVPTSDVDNISGSFSDGGFFAPIQYLEPDKAPGPNGIFPKLIMLQSPGCVASSPPACNSSKYLKCGEVR